MSARLAATESIIESDSVNRPLHGKLAGHAAPAAQPSRAAAQKSKPATRPAAVHTARPKRTLATSQVGACSLSGWPQLMSKTRFCVLLSSSEHSAHARLVVEFVCPAQMQALAGRSVRQRTFQRQAPQPAPRRHVAFGSIMREAKQPPPDPVAVRLPAQFCSGPNVRFHHRAACSALRPACDHRCHHHVINLAVTQLQGASGSRVQQQKRPKPSLPCPKPRSVPAAVQTFVTSPAQQPPAVVQSRQTAGG